VKVLETICGNLITIGAVSSLFNREISVYLTLGNTSEYHLVTSWFASIGVWFCIRSRLELHPTL
jgi:hypothetical protein